MKHSSIVGSAITVFIITWISIFELVECQRRPFQNQRPQFPEDSDDSFFSEMSGIQQPPQQRPTTRPTTTTTPRNCANIICTAEYNPVCARRSAESRTFNNRCLVNRENLCGAAGNNAQQWQVSRLGICAPILSTN